MANPVVPELEVLLGSIMYLWGRGAHPRHVSISRLSRAGPVADRERLKAELDKAGIPDIPIYSDGADLVAASATELWYVECKGASAKRDNPGIAAPFGTHRNQFDRALASVVLR